MKNASQQRGFINPARFFRVGITFSLILLILTSCNGSNPQEMMPTLVPLPANEISTLRPRPTTTTDIAASATSELPSTGSPLESLSGTARQTTLLPPGRLATSTSPATETSIPFTLTPSQEPSLEPSATSTLTPVIPTLLPLPIATIIEATSVSAGEDFYIAVSGLPVEYTALPAPTGQHWIIVIATLANNSDHNLKVTEQQLRLVDSAGHRYLPAAPDSSTVPPLIGLKLKPNESLRGEVRYGLPATAVPAALEWCLNDDCTQTIQSLIP